MSTRRLFQLSFLLYVLTSCAAVAEEPASTVDFLLKRMDVVKDYATFRCPAGVE